MTQLADKPNQHEIEPFRVTLEEFFRLGHEGFFEGRHVELIDGEIQVMPPQGPIHVRRVYTLNERLVEHFKDVAIVLTQSTLVLDAFTQKALEPDLALIRRPSDESEYDRRSPDANDALLVIEVSDTTIKRDRTTKLELYAKYGVPEVWIFDVGTNQLEVNREPAGETYKTKFTLAVGKTCSPVAFPTRDVTWWV
jgi:Uma2 family endonuclease